MCTPVQQERERRREGERARERQRARRESESDGGESESDGGGRGFLPVMLTFALLFVVADRRLHSLRAGNPLFEAAKEEHRQQQHGEAHGLNPENGFFFTNEELYRM